MLAAALLAAAHLIPIAAAVATSALVSRRLSEPDGWWENITRFGLLAAASTVVLVAVDRVARRLLPLAALLKLSMVFPDRAPRRLTVAIRSGSIKNLQARLEEAKALGEEDEPTRAAEVILSLVGALHGHDRQTRGHSERVRWFADLIADELRLPQEDRDRLRWAALLHDIGKLRVRRRILNKPRALTAHEWKHIHRHPEEGARITAPLHNWLGDWSLTISQHHERYDGTGYPAGLKGDDISMGARIVAVADAYEVMTAVRAYKKAMSATEARGELTRCAGQHFDPAIVRAFLNVSIGRLRWIAGPTAWVAQLPFIGWVPRLADGAVALSGQAVGVVGAAAGAATLSTSGVMPAVSAPDPSLVPSNPPVLLDIPTPAPAQVLGTEVTRDQGSSSAATSAGTPVLLDPAGAGGSGASEAATTTTVPPPGAQGQGDERRSDQAPVETTTTTTPDTGHGADRGPATPPGQQKK